jgi:AraC-like DNA-binding protein
MNQNIIIKNMVCPRCIEAVRLAFQELSIPFSDISLGRVNTPLQLTTDQRQGLKNKLAEKGFELLNDKQSRLINEIKSLIIQEIHYGEEINPLNFSTLIAEKTNYDYSYLSRLFSSVEGRTIENFVLAQKIEKVKELLTYGELTVSEIAFQMNYSSAAHLSSQFRKVTGMSPSAFRKLQDQGRQSLDDV